MLDVTRVQTASEGVTEIAKAVVALPIADIDRSDVSMPFVKTEGDQMPDPNAVRITRLPRELIHVKECFIFRTRVRSLIQLADTGVALRLVVEKISKSSFSLRDYPSRRAGYELFLKRSITSRSVSNNCNRSFCYEAAMTN